MTVRWLIRAVNLFDPEQIMQAGHDGWEPFAVNSNAVWLRKRKED